MRAQLEQRLKELQKEYESGQKILKNIEISLEDLENKKGNLKETLLRISGAIEVLEEELAKSREENRDKGAAAGVLTDFMASKAAESVEVPDVSRKPLETARKIIEEAGLFVGEISEKNIFIGGIGFGEVIRQHPEPATKVKPGSAVDLTITGKGKFKPDLDKNSNLHCMME